MVKVIFPHANYCDHIQKYFELTDGLDIRLDLHHDLAFLLLGGVHKLRLQDLAFFTPLRLHFLWYKCLQKVDFFDHLPPSSCKRSL